MPTLEREPIKQRTSISTEKWAIYVCQYLCVLCPEEVVPVRDTGAFVPGREGIPDAGHATFNPLSS
jgi:hypothetical protein